MYFHSIVDNSNLMILNIIVTFIIQSYFNKNHIASVSNNKKYLKPRGQNQYYVSEQDPVGY